jgi:hypothetical protein
MIGGMKMYNVVELYEIVPVGDGSHYMCRNEAGEYYRQHKAYHNKDQLAFYTEEIAQKYIDKYLDSELYKPEWFGYNLDYLFFEIITEVD